MIIQKCFSNDSRSNSKRGNKNPNWKGDNVGYSSLHTFVRRRKKKPKLCDICHVSPPIDLANKTGNYLRILSDWNWLCRKCHMFKDGRIEKLISFARSKRSPNKICPECKKNYYKGSDTKDSKFCSRKCFNENRRLKCGWIKKNKEWISKPCNSCRKILLLTEFYFIKSRNKLSTVCKICS